MLMATGVWKQRSVPLESVCEWKNTRFDKWFYCVGWGIKLLQLQSNWQVILLVIIRRLTRQKTH